MISICQYLMNWLIYDVSFFTIISTWLIPTLLSSEVLEESVYKVNSRTSNHQEYNWVHKIIRWKFSVEEKKESCKIPRSKPIFLPLELRQNSENPQHHCKWSLTIQSENKDIVWEMLSTPKVFSVLKGKRHWW